MSEEKNFLLCLASPWRWLSGRCISEIPLCAPMWSPPLPTSGCLIWGEVGVSLIREQEHLARCDFHPSLWKTSLLRQPSSLTGRELILAAEGTVQKSPLRKRQGLVRVEENSSEFFVLLHPSSPLGLHQSRGDAWGRRVKHCTFGIVLWLFTWAWSCHVLQGWEGICRLA